MKFSIIFIYLLRQFFASVYSTIGIGSYEILAQSIRARRCQTSFLEVHLLLLQVPIVFTLLLLPRVFLAFIQQGAFLEAIFSPWFTFIRDSKLPSIWYLRGSFQSNIDRNLLSFLSPAHKSKEWYLFFRKLLLPQRSFSA